ncbi:signal peptidase I [Dietzia lutea]|uniref:S26 family signal peptidase n=1 Tax=Dietzia lutea TaxID=546160 RepID=A0A2S1R9A2_9ACTN|nr:signal peptidase I [Dietzia lutea]AWH92869.1 hypothetical protein A6035_12615 [Dietzia lutea]
MTAPTRTPPRRAREIALNLGAALGLLCLLAASASLFLGITPLVFRSGSMAPTIPTGALGLATSVPAVELEPGDIVSVDDATGDRITHRAIDVEPLADGSAAVRMRGDANDAPDRAPYVVSEADRVFFHVDHLGYAVAWLSTPVAIFLGGMLAGGAAVIAFGRTRNTQEGDPADADSPALTGAGDNRFARDEDGIGRG